MDRTAQALDSFDRALALKPDYLDAIVNRGNALSTLGRLQEALESFEAALVLNPRNSLVLFSHGNALCKLKRPSEALDSFDRALALNPELAGVHPNRGNALHQLNRPEEALESYDHALAVDPHSYETYLNRGIVLFLELDRLEEAILGFNQAIKIKPDFADAYSNRGWELFCWIPLVPNSATLPTGNPWGLGQWGAESGSEFSATKGSQNNQVTLTQAYSSIIDLGGRGALGSDFSPAWGSDWAAGGWGGCFPEWPLSFCRSAMGSAGYSPELLKRSTSLMGHPFVYSCAAGGGLAGDSAAPGQFNS